MGKGGIDVAVPAVSDFGRFNHASGLPAPVEHDPALAWCRGVRLILGAAGRGLNALEHELEQLVGEFGAVAEGERTQARVFFGGGARGHVLNPPAIVWTSNGLKP